MTLIKIDGQVPTKLGNLAPKCHKCAERIARARAAGIPELQIRPAGGVQFLGLTDPARRKDGKVFSVWQCTVPTCGECVKHPVTGKTVWLRTQSFYWEHSSSIDIDNPNCIMADDSECWGLENAVAVNRNF